MKRGILTSTLICLGLFLITSLASAAVDKVICVPWQGDITKPHTAISGQAVQLKGVIKTTDTSMVWYKWVFADGTPDSAITPLSGATKYNVAVTHTYTAATGTPFTAQLQVANNNAVADPKVVDPYLLKIEDNTIDTQINIAIDKGLWWLYTNPYSNSNNGTYNGQPFMTWYQSSYVFVQACPTASAIQAFAINNHKYHGNPDQDPYVEAVQLGMNWLTSGHYGSAPMLNAVTISTQHGSDNPDANGNGLGIQVYDYPSGDRTPYQGGQVMDAIIASGVLPTDLTGRDFAPGTAQSHNWTFGELLQDMADMYAWGQWDGGGCNGGICGSWWYNWNYSSPGDNSASQWAAIGFIPAQQPPWNVIVPSWVKTYNSNWLVYSFCASGNTGLGTQAYFGYNGGCGSYNDYALNTTPSGMVQMILDGQNTSDAKWVASQKSMADYWNTFMNVASNSWGDNRTYGWYSFAKAMRLALPSPVDVITTTGGKSFDWYRGDGSGNPAYKGMAQRILEIQNSDGHWDGELTNAPLTTAWVIVILRPTLFQAAPSACFTAQPNPSFPDQNIFFDPSCSSPASGTGTSLVKYEWDWNNDGTYDQSTPTPDIVTHQFPCATVPCTYPVKLRVTDNNVPPATATTTLNINITNPPHPPVANAGGPYMVGLCSTDSLMLDGSGSFDPDQGQHQAGCGTCPNDTITAWDWDLVPPLTFDSINRSGKTVTLTPAELVSLGLTSGAHSIGLRVTDNTALAYPGSGQPNLTNAAFGTVNVYAGCICNLAARAKLTKIQLTWTPGAPSYDIYRSTAGPNTGFVRIAQNYVTTYATYLDETTVTGVKYYYRVVANFAAAPCGSNAASATPTNR